MAEPTRNFSSEENGYSRREVDESIDKVQAAIRNIEAQNQKLYQDCVHFARRLKNIQDSGILDENIAELKQQNAQYAREIQELQAQLSALSYEETVPEEPEENMPARKSHRVLRGFLIFFLVIFLLVGIFSIAFHAVEQSGSSKSPIRGYYIDNNALPSSAKAGDIMLVKREDPDELNPGDVILFDLGSQRTLGILQKAVHSDGQTKYEISMNGNTYAFVTPTQYLGTAKCRLPGMGNFVTWAVQNAAVYYLMLCLILALIILGLAMVPGKRKES
ncbi:MAG: hypothetical protein ACI4IA_04600 [Acutalibacteraceae bacterium]